MLMAPSAAYLTMPAETYPLPQGRTGSYLRGASVYPPNRWEGHGRINNGQAEQSKKQKCALHCMLHEGCLML
jgi:hypothetical protein